MSARPRQFPDTCSWAALERWEPDYLGGRGKMANPMTDVRDISRIAYGFMGSKALFSALNINLFGRLAQSSKTVEVLIEETGIPANRLRTLLSALTAIGL